VFDKDLYTADDMIGSVTIDLNSLLAEGSQGRILGWFPLFDTLRGIRGYLRLMIKLEFFGDVNPFKETSAGVQFFSVCSLEGHELREIHGFVEVRRALFQDTAHLRSILFNYRHRFMAGAHR